MKTLFTKTFIKDLEKLSNKKISIRLRNEIESIKKANHIGKLNNIKKMEGYNKYFRTRIGDYRLGLKIENDTVTFIRFKHRKEIYKVFP